MSQKFYTRRQVAGGLAAASGAIALPSKVQAQVVPCAALERLISRAEDARLTAGPWALTVAPQHLRNLDAALRRLETELGRSQGQETEERTRQLVSYINTLGSITILIVGITGATATAPLIVGSITFAGTMLIVEALVAPRAIDGFSVVRDNTINRAGSIFDAAGDKAYTLSTRSAVYSRAAGTLLGVVGAAYTAGDFFRRTKDFRRATAERQRLEQSLADTRQALTNFNALEVRQACARAVAEDATSFRISECRQAP